jgi:hypothetical protein
MAVALKDVEMGAVKTEEESSEAENNFIWGKLLVIP